MSQTQTRPEIEHLAATNAEPQKEHQWLQKLVGDWTYETDVPTSATRPSTKATGTERVRPLGGPSLPRITGELKPNGKHPEHMHSHLRLPYG